ncbi:unnamed protein product [Rotaria sp. Silwood1]|nr:unnamed protein product [Rotaria sp. Silwood1]
MREQWELPLPELIISVTGGAKFFQLTPPRDSQLDSALSDALRHESVQFVELLVEQGASFDRLRRIIKIDDLYKTKNGLPLSRKRKAILCDRQRAYYEEYLNIEASRITSHTSTTYGSIVGCCHEDITLNGKVVFNQNDAVRYNGYVNQIIIGFSQTHSVFESSYSIDLYIISPTMQSGSFQILDRRQINRENTKTNTNEFKFDLPDSTIYLESGQYLAVGFKENSSVIPKCFVGYHSYYSFNLDVVNKAYSDNKTIVFDKYNRLSVAISFQLVPTSGKTIVL